VQVGDPVLLRSVYRGRVRWGFPHHFVGESEECLVLYCQPGNRGVVMGRDEDGRYLERWARGDPPHERTWDRMHVLRLVRPGAAHTIEVCWDESWRPLGWYVNLQAPIRRTALGFDTTDWALDVVVEPDGSWRWKDEDDFAEAQTLGILDAAAAAVVRAEGERVIAERPWPTGWEDWRPPASWTPLPLPPEWDVVA
jgi:hypothetical protein